MNSRIRPPANKDGFDFKCLCCGTCCTRYQPRISAAEAETIAKNLNITVDQFVKQYTDRRWPGVQSFLIRQADSACIFLKPSSDGLSKLCSIHAFKPACCLEWEARPDRPECQEGLNRRWNAGMPT